MKKGMILLVLLLLTLPHELFAGEKEALSCHLLAPGAALRPFDIWA